MGDYDDRALLESAATAAGVPGKYDDAHHGIVVWHVGDVYPVQRWNPLTNDGDAFRLAVALRLEVAVRETYSGVVNGNLIGGIEQHTDDPYAATRRAIVRAAAELGRAP